MKTTFDLPDALLKQIRRRAAREGRSLKDTVVDLLLRGLAAGADAEPVRPAVIRRDKETGLPVIECRRAPTPHEGMTPERVADILLAQEVDWHRTAGR